MKKSLIIMIALLQIGCSLAPSAANRSEKAYNAGEYAEAIRLVNRALLTYEYSNEDKANLLFLKAESYAKLKHYTHAFGVLQYILNTYPETEAYFKAKSLVSAVTKHLQKHPVVKPKVIPKPISQDV